MFRVVINPVGPEMSPSAVNQCFEEGEGVHRGRLGLSRLLRKGDDAFAARNYPAPGLILLVFAQLVPLSPLMNPCAIIADRKLGSRWEFSSGIL